MKGQWRVNEGSQSGHSRVWIPTDLTSGSLEGCSSIVVLMSGQNIVRGRARLGYITPE